MREKGRYPSGRAVVEFDETQRPTIRCSTQLVRRACHASLLIIPPAMPVGGMAPPMRLRSWFMFCASNAVTNQGTSAVSSGLDIGTTGCKAGVFVPKAFDGLGREYPLPSRGWAELTPSRSAACLAVIKARPMLVIRWPQWNLLPGRGLRPWRPMGGSATHGVVRCDGFDR